MNAKPVQLTTLTKHMNTEPIQAIQNIQ